MLAVGVTAATSVATGNPAMAAGTTCRTVALGGEPGGITIRPYMFVPVCYNGSRIWVSGGITPGVSGWGYTYGGFDWYGSYNDGSQNWLGVGENFSATAWGGWASLYCAPRWYINAWGNKYAYERKCR